MADKYVTTTGTEPWATNSLALPSSLEEARTNAAAGDTVHIKAGTYTLTASFSPTGAGTRNAPIVWRGYSVNPNDAASPVVTFDINGLSLSVINCAQAHHRFENITATGNAGLGGNIYGAEITGIATVLYRCRCTSVQKAILLTGQGSEVAGCEIDNWTLGAGVQLDGDNTSAFGCFAHDGGGSGFGFKSASSGGCYSCIAARNAANGFVAGQSGESLSRFLINCVAASNTQNGIAINGTPEGQPFKVQNCLLVNNTLFGIAGDATGLPNVSLYGCGFFGNVSGEVDPNVYVFEPGGRLSLPADPFVDAAGDDFRIRSQAGAGQVGWPANFLVGGVLSPWQNYADIGAVQKREWSRA